MHRKTFFCLITLILMTSCHKSDPYTTLAGYIADGLTTRTVINRTDSAQIVWSPGDSICVWDRGKQAAAIYVLSSGGQTTGIFKGSDLNNPYVALYPYQPDARYHKGVQYTHPCTQRAVAHGYDHHAQIMLGSIQGSNITFETQVAWLRLTTPEDTHGLRAIRLSPNSLDQRLSTDSAWVEIVSATDLQPSCDYYLTALPGTYDAGLSIRLSYADGTKRESRSSDPLTLSRAKVQPLTLKSKSAK